MAVIAEAIRVEPNNSLSFGNYHVSEKIKINEFNHDGDIYDLRTHDKITRLQKNGSLLIETVPGATLHNFGMDGKLVRFEIEGRGDAQITLELEPNIEYKIFVDDMNIGSSTSKLSGKLIFSLSLNSNIQSVKIEKI
ncbi:MAG: endosialidase [Clostridiales bacterium]|nr:endosialidase [Clostridiales bacterium]